MAKRRKRAEIASMIIGWLLSIVVLVPFSLIVINSFKTSRDAVLMQLTWPRDGFILDNYIEILGGDFIFRSFFNSLLISTSCVILCVMVSAMASFVIKRRRTRFHSVVFYLFFAGLIAPMNYVTTLHVLRVFNMNGTFQGLILTYVAMGIPFASFLYYNFMSTFPCEIDEASIIDGANTLNLFSRVIFPLLTPITITVGTLTFISSWNDFISPLFLLNRSTRWGMILMVYNYWGFLNQEWGMISAIIVLTLLPILALYVAMQKYIIAGMTQGAIKG